MSVTNREFLEAADILSNGNREIDYRNSVSRAYYAGYHKAQELITRNIVALAGNAHSGSHERLIDSLTSSSILRIRSIGYMLNSCRNQRTEADYILQIDFPKNKAAVMLGTVEELIKRIDEIIKENN